MKKNVTIEITESICPICKRVVKAKVYNHNDQVFMKKICPLHGTFVSPYRIEDKCLYKIVSSIFKNEVDFQKIYKKSFSIFSGKWEGLGVYLTGKCSLKCPFCFQGDKSISIDELSKKDFEKIVKLYPYLKEVSIAGGEVTERDDLFNIIKFLRKKGIRVDFTTNGIKTANEEYVKKLKLCGINHIIISHQITSGSFKKNMGVDLSSYIHKSINNFKRFKINFSFSVTVDEKNFSNLWNFIEYAVDVGASFIRISPLFSTRFNPLPKTEITSSDIIWKICEHLEMSPNELRKMILFRYVGEKVYYLLKLGLYKKRLCNFLIWVKKSDNKITKFTDTLVFKILYFILRIMSSRFFEFFLKGIGKLGILNIFNSFKKLSFFNFSTNIFTIVVMNYMNPYNLDLKYLRYCNGVQIPKKKYIQNPISFCLYWMIGDDALR